MSTQAISSILTGMLGIGYPTDQTLLPYFRSHVGRSPESLALVCGKRSLTYKELDRISDVLAANLIATGLVGKETKVALLLERSERIVISILAVMKAGAAYVPIDPAYPSTRMRYILDDSAAAIVITETPCLLKDFPSDIAVIDLDFVTWERSVDRKLPDPAPTDLAYIIYTSGSTGQPKGVMIEHRNVLRLFFNDAPIFDFSADDTWMLFHSYCFDVSVWEIFGALLFGGRLIICSKAELADPGMLIDILKREQVTILNETPSSFYILADYLSLSVTDGLSIRFVMLAGEALRPAKLAQWKAKYPGIKIFNMYGPTEATVYAAWKEIGDIEIKQNLSVIGTALPTLGLYVLDEQKQPVQIGEVGELYITGAGLARGYLNQSELTRQKFIPSPFEAGHYLYQSGDRVRMLASGEIEYIGRMDDQVKIRGYRVELGEVEYALSNLPGVIDTLITFYEEEGVMSLVAYFTLSQHLWTTEDLRTALVGILPEYMVPTYFIPLEHFPLNHNGKKDKSRLPHPGGKSSQYIVGRAASNDVEKALMKIWHRILGMDNIGVDKHFLTIGGNSLNGTMLSNLIQLHFGVSFGVKELFANPTIELQANYLAKAAVAGKKESSTARKYDKRLFYPLSSVQKRLYAIWHLEEEESGTTYNESYLYKINGEFNNKRAREAVLKIIQRHEALRTRFDFVNHELVQIIEPKISFPFQRYAVDKEDFDYTINNCIFPFNLHQAPLFRITQIEVSNGERFILLDFHHIIMDGITMHILRDEFTKLYDGATLNDTYLDYTDYVLQTYENEEKEKRRSDLVFWKEMLRNPGEPFLLPSDQARGSHQRFDGKECSLFLDATESIRLKRLAITYKVTPFVLLLSVYGSLCHKYTGVEDLILGTVTAGRRESEFEHVAGNFTNTLPLRMQITANQSFASLLNATNQMVMGALAHQDCPFEELVQELLPERDAGQHPLFNNLFVFQDRRISTEEMRFEGAALQKVMIPANKVKAEIWFEVLDLVDTFKVRLVYNAMLFEEQRMKRMLSHYINLLRLVLKDVHTEIGALDILTVGERNCLLKTFNRTAYVYDKGRSLAALFSQSCRLYSHEPALIDRNGSMSYGELHRKSNQLARFLCDQGVKRGDHVGLILGRSSELLIALWAVIKTGAAYVPIDPQFPAERQTYMMEKCGMKWMIGNDEHIVYVAGVQLFTLSHFDFDRYAPDELDHVLHAGDPLYTIFTSGSTGKPKGVVISHQAVHNFLHGMRQHITFQPGRRVLALTTVSFDIFVLEAIIPCLTGSTVVLADEQAQTDLTLLNSFMCKHKIDILQVTPSRLHWLLAEPGFQVVLSQLSELLVGGETFNPTLLGPLQQNKQLKLWNVYGPTETTVWSTIKELSGSEQVTIGSPIANTQIYILNKEQQLVPVGIPGEIYIAGDGLALGYLDEDALTAERFLPNPFDKGKKMYRTGDLGMWTSDGEITCLGRADHQVKIRGYRIEPAEIEAVILQFPGITSTVVIAEQGYQGGNYLIAYYVSEMEVEPEAFNLFLAKELPAYMIPAIYHLMEELPLTPNLKIDRKALPKPPVPKETTKASSPGNAIHALLFGIWHKLLQHDQIGLHDNFFAIGGNSISLVKMSYALKENGFEDVHVTDIFSNPTIFKLAEKIGSLKQPASIPEAGLLTLPPSYFSEKKGTGLIQYTKVFNASDLHQLLLLSEIYEVQVRDILLSVFFYQLHMISRKEKIMVTALKDQTKAAYNYLINYELVEDIADIVAQLNNQRDIKPFSFSIAHIDELASVKNSAIRPLFVSNTELVIDQTIAKYEWILSVQQEPSHFQLTLYANPLRFGKGKTREVFSGLTDTILAIINAAAQSEQLA